MDSPTNYTNYVYEGGTAPHDIKKHIIHVKVDPSVTKIDNEAFEKCLSLTTIDLPDGVTSLGYRTFYGCSSLTTIDLPDGVTSLGYRTFYGCSSLTTIDLPDGVTSLGYRTFAYCSSLTTIDLPNGVTSLCNETFLGCSSLTTINLPDGFTSLGDETFVNCSSLTTIYLPDGVTSLGDRTFFGCSSLTTINLPDGVTSLGDSTFEGCSSLTTIHLQDGVRSIGDSTFKDCESLSIISIPSTTVVGNDAFKNCYTLLKEQNDDGQPVNLVELLKKRFHYLPLHMACYRAKNDDDFDLEILTKEAACMTDTFIHTPLHILAANSHATKHMIELVIGLYSDAVTRTDNSGKMCPLHYAATNPGEHVKDFLPLLTNIRPSYGGKLVCTTLQNKDSRTPTVLSILYNPDEKVQRHLFKYHPCDESQFDAKKHRDQVKMLEQGYVDDFTKQSAQDSIIPSIGEEHGWVELASSVGDKRSIRKICDFIRDEKNSKELVQKLADAQDDEGRKAIDVAVQEVRSAFLERLLFLGRYDIKKGPLTHKSDTCIVVEAFDMKDEEYYKKIFEKYSGEPTEQSCLSFEFILGKLNVAQVGNGNFPEETLKHFGVDNNGLISKDAFVKFCKAMLSRGKYRKVALKFMKKMEQFHKEIDFRKKLGLQLTVIDIDEEYNASNNPSFRSAIEHFTLSGTTEQLQDYKYLLVMPCADRNLDAISRSEKPDLNKIRSDTYQIASKLKNLHDKDIVHGDLKKSNIVRLGEQMVLIDLDAASNIDKDSSSPSSFVGKKFSSGVLPPEMIHSLKDKAEKEAYEEYFKEDDSNESSKIWWEKIQPKCTQDGEAWLVVKTFDTGEEESKFDSNKVIESVKKGLPYELVKATEASDLWSFGAILYSLCTGHSLFEVNVDDDLVDGDAMRKLSHWSDDERKRKMSHEKIKKDPLVKNLLNKLLSKEPEKRGTIIELINDDFFKSNDLVSASAVMEKVDETNKIVKESNQIGKENMKIGKENMKIGKENMKIGKENNVILKNLSQAQKEEFAKTRKNLLHAIYEATEVSHPTTFVVLNNKVPDLTPEEEASIKEQLGNLLGNDGQGFNIDDNTNLSQLHQAIKYTQDLCSVKDAIEEKDSKGFFDVVESRFKDLMTEETMYFYLIDEVTGKPVKKGKYPLKITTPSKIVPKMLPLIQIGMKAMSLYNGVGGIIQMFGFPFLPQVPKPIRDKMQDSVHILKQPSSVGAFNVVHEEVKKGDEESASVRGASLRELKRFLNEKDVHNDFAGLRRVYDEDGGALWTAVPEQDIQKHLDDRSKMRVAQEHESELVEYYEMRLNNKLKAQEEELTWNDESKLVVELRLELKAQDEELNDLTELLEEPCIKCIIS